MLAYLLAMAVGLASVSLYMAAFFFPEVHRRYDLIWSGVGLFYALVLWVCAGRITGAVLLGQIASVALLGWFGWQTLVLRRAQTPIDQQTQLPESATSGVEVVQATWQQMRAGFQQTANRSPLAAQLDRWIEQLGDSWLAATSWIKALASTALDKSEDKLDGKLDPSTSEPSLPLSSKGGFEQKQPAATDEFYAEWDDLEVESHPELDTIDAAGVEAMGLNLSAPPSQHVITTNSQSQPIHPPQPPEP